MVNLLKPNALEGIRLAISVSGSPDLLRLGLLEIHFRLALGELARCVLSSSGEITYGGHLDPTGYTAFLLNELERYGRRTRPLHICLASSEHRKLALSRLEQERRQLGLFGDLVCVDLSGAEVNPPTERGEQPLPPHDEATEIKSLTALRTFMTGNTHGRILLGGKRNGFRGDMPGILEEAIMAMDAKQPIYLAGGFGGMTWDIANALDLVDQNYLPSLANAPQPDPKAVGGLGRLMDVAKGTSYASLENGLSKDENRQLAASYRPSEIAALVSLGLSRRFAKS